MTQQVPARSEVPEVPHLLGQVDETEASAITPPETPVTSNRTEVRDAAIPDALKSGGVNWSLTCPNSLPMDNDEEDELLTGGCCWVPTVIETKPPPSSRRGRHVPQVSELPFDDEDCFSPSMLQEFHTGGLDTIRSNSTESED